MAMEDTAPLVMRELAKCPFCDGEIYPRYTGIPDRLETTSATFSVAQCAVCETGMLNPAPVGDISSFYPPNYLSGEAGGGSSPRFDFERWYRYNQYAYDFKLQAQASGSNIAASAGYIDLGCGSGERVTYAAEQGCRRAVGIDRFDFAKNEVHDKAELIHAELLDYAPEEKFQTASLFHVLEHLESPSAVVAHIRAEILAPGGELIVQVPNYGSLERRWFGARWFGLDAPRHYWHFNEDSLRSFLTDHGYEVHAIYQRNAPLHPVTIVSSLFPALDVQRIWVKRSKGEAYRRRMTVLWAALSVLTIPICVLENLCGRASMLTAIASARAQA